LGATTSQYHCPFWRLTGWEDQTMTVNPYFYRFELAVIQKILARLALIAVKELKRDSRLLEQSC
jgi:hypothetical protein